MLHLYETLLLFFLFARRQIRRSKQKTAGFRCRKRFLRSEGVRCYAERAKKRLEKKKI